MSGIFDGIQTIINGIVTLITFLGNLLKTLILVPRYIYKAMVTLTTYIGTFPAWLLSFAMISLTVIVVYQLVGRSSK